MDSATRVAGPTDSGRAKEKKSDRKTKVTHGQQQKIEESQSRQQSMCGGVAPLAVRPCQFPSSFLSFFLLLFSSFFLGPPLAAVVSFCGSETKTRRRSAAIQFESSTAQVWTATTTTTKKRRDNQKIRWNQRGIPLKADTSQKKRDRNPRSEVGELKKLHFPEAHDWKPMNRKKEIKFERFGLGNLKKISSCSALGKLKQSKLNSNRIIWMTQKVKLPKITSIKKYRSNQRKPINRKKETKFERFGLDSSKKVLVAVHWAN